MGMGFTSTPPADTRATRLRMNPTRFSQDELTRILAADPEDRAHRKAVIEAIGALVAAGLLHRDGHFVLPIRAAIDFDRLVDRT